MNDSIMQIFDYKGQKVRTIEQDGAFWFVAKDICDILGLTNARKAIKSLDNDERMTVTISYGQTITKQKGGAREINIVSEPGMYKLIFKSRKSDAKNFTRWVVHDLLPSVREHGMYLAPKIAELYKSDPDAFTQLADKYINERTRNAQLEVENVKLRAQIDGERAYTNLGHIVLALPGAMTFQEAAHLLAQQGLDIGQNRLFSKCRELKLLCSRKGRQWNKPSQKGVERGLVNSQIEGGFRTITLITPQALSFLSDILMQEQFPIIAMCEAAENSDK